MTGFDRKWKESKTTDQKLDCLYEAMAKLIQVCQDLCGDVKECSNQLGKVEKKLEKIPEIKTSRK
jgi:hypothetical protein